MALMWVDVTSMWHRCGIDVASMWIDVASTMWIDAASMWHRCGFDVASMFHRCGIDADRWLKKMKNETYEENYMEQR